ncbi:MAG: hypothetical protein ACLQEQ_06115 [Nitrososphaerales archaeon]
MSDFIGDVGNVVVEAFQSYIGWFVVQVMLDAFFPGFALLVNIGFVVFTFIGLLAGLDEILNAPTIAVFALSVLSLAINVWLIQNAG